MYYLQSRYYNPTWGRFINADALVSTGQGIIGNNMFAYCRNNPVIRSDVPGTNDICVVSGDDDNPLDDLGYPSAGGGGSFSSGGYVAGVSSSYYAMQNVRAYDSWWRNSCYNPNMTWSNSVAQHASVASIPPHAWDTLDYIKNHNGAPPKGYKGGKPFENDGRNGGERLPNNYSPFREYDVYPKVAGQGRGTERIVIGNGATWYTYDHYITFIRME